MSKTKVSVSFSRVSTKNQTVLPRLVRNTLGIGPGDRLRYRMTKQGVLLDKAPRIETDTAFVVFFEWSGKADDRAYANL